MAHTDPASQRARNNRAKQAVLDANALRISRLRACCAPLAVVGVGIAHHPDLCGECKALATALNKPRSSSDGLPCATLPGANSAGSGESCSQPFFNEGNV
jgi:hypothetical protein